MYILANITVNEDLSDEIQLELTADRCQISHDTCELFESIVLKDVCSRLPITRIGKDFISAVRPPVTNCPLVKGNYYFENLSIDLNCFSILPIENYRWLIKLQEFDMVDRPNKKLVFCVIGQIRVMLNGGRRRKPKSHY